MKNYSQNDEQSFIENYFKSHAPKYGGKFLDIGAYDGITFSNTYALLENGWSGVMVEASPSVFTALQHNMKGKNVELCNSCIVTQPILGMIDFYDCGDAVATNDVDHMRKWSNAVTFEKIKVMPVHYNGLLSIYGKDFDMVDIDIEGKSAELFLLMFPLMPNVDLWVVEHDERRSEILDLAVGFDVLYSNGENLVLGRNVSSYPV